MISPRATCLVRVPDAPAMQQAVIAHACADADRRTAVIVPTQSAAAELRRTIENELLVHGGRTAVVLPDGSVGDVRIVRSLDKRFGLDEEAIKAVKQWRFRPAMQDGVAMQAVGMVPIAFTMR